MKMGAMSAGQVDLVASTADEFPTYMRDGYPMRYILAVDNSNGGDGIVAKQEIADVAGLKGHSVAFEEGSVSQFFLNALLLKAGLTQADVQPVNMTATDAGVAFVAGRVDAAVTWEPHLSLGAQSEGGKILITSADAPGLIVDVVAVSDETLAARHDEIAGFVRGWQKSLDFLESNPDEAYEIMAKGVGGWLTDPNEFKAAASGIEYLSLDRNRELFGTAEAPGQLADTLANAITIWSDLGRIKATGLNSGDILDRQFLN
jgi:NitT/TauT family transport system substrate-binding protein